MRLLVLMVLLVKNGPWGTRKHRKMIMLFIITLTNLVMRFPKERKACGCHHLEDYKTCVEIIQLASPVCSNPHLSSLNLRALPPMHSL